MRYTILAGENELASNAHDEALLHFQQGLGAMQIATTGTESVNDSESAALLYGFGRAQLITQGRSKLSEATSCLCRAFNYYEEAGELENAVKIAQYPFPQAIGLRTGAAQLIKRALAFVQNGSHDEGVLLSQYSRSVFSEENDYEAACDAYNQASVIAHRESDWEAAGRFSGQGLELFPNDCRSLGTRVQLEFEQGKFDQGAQFLERLIQAMRLAPAGPNFESMIPALGLPLAARISGIYDYHEVAKAAADAVISAPNASKMVLWGAKAGLGLMAVQRGDSIAAADQSAALSSGRGTGTVVISLCLDRLLGLLSQAMGDLELAVDHYKDSLSFCREADYRPELAWTCHDYAGALLERKYAGDQALGIDLLDESISLSGDLGMRTLSERARALKDRAESGPPRAPAYPDGLTEREVEVLHLVAAGRPDREIAEELIISLRTGNAHVRNILNKTGAANRAEAATYANRNGLD